MMDNFTGNITDFDTRLFDYPQPFSQTPVAEIVIKILIYSVLILTAVVGNTLIILVVFKNKRMQTTTNYFLVNLAVSDLLVTFSCSWVHLVDDLTEGWVLGTFLCQFNSFAQVTSLVSSILSLTLVACDRFFGIVYAMKAHIIERKAKPVIICLWIISAAVASPMLFFRKVYERHWKNHVERWCNDGEWSLQGGGYSKSSRVAYWTVISTILFILPIISMVCAYCGIIKTLWSTKIPGERVYKENMAQIKMKRKVVLMLLTILAVFAVCWFPLQISILYSEYRDHSTQMGDWYETLSFCARLLAFSNSAINPLIYAVFNENFRKAGTYNPVQMSWADASRSCQLLGAWDDEPYSIKDTYISGRVGFPHWHQLMWIGAFVRQTKWFQLYDCYYISGSSNQTAIVDFVRPVYECYTFCQQDDYTSFGLSSSSCYCFDELQNYRTDEDRTCKYRTFTGTGDWYGESKSDSSGTAVAVYRIDDKTPVYANDNTNDDCAAVTKTSYYGAGKHSFLHCEYVRTNSICNDGRVNTEALIYSQAVEKCRNPLLVNYQGNYNYNPAISHLKRPVWTGIIRRSFPVWSATLPVAEERINCIAVRVLPNGRIFPKHFIRDCSVKFPSICEPSTRVDGNWSEWGQFGECSSSCGAGKQTRSRTCTNPKPQHGGEACYGSATEKRDCFSDDCIS